MKKGNKQCPLCETEMVDFERYPNYICWTCAEKTVTKEGDKIDFYNEGPDGGFYSVVNKKKGSIHECYVDGNLCNAQEGRFGGIIVSLVSPDYPKEAKNS